MRSLCMRAWKNAVTLWKSRKQMANTSSCLFHLWQCSCNCLPTVESGNRSPFALPSHGRAGAAPLFCGHRITLLEMQVTSGHHMVEQDVKWSPRSLLLLPGFISQNAFFSSQYFSSSLHYFYTLS